MSGVVDGRGRVVIVTGGTGFLGTDVCLAFLTSGAAVVAVYLFDRELPYFRKRLGTAANRVEIEKADTAKPGEMDRVVAAVVKRHGRVDALVHTVGGYMAGAVEDSAKEFDAVFDRNLKAAFLAAKAVIPVMKKQRRGKLAFVSTRTALRGEAEAFLYSASKSGINRLVETLAEELMDFNVQVNCVMPSVMDTPANREWMAKGQVEKAVKTEHVAAVLRWLCSEEADPISGAAIPVYGRS